MKKQNVLNLIKYHAEKNDLAFKNEVQLIAKSFDKAGDSQLAEYILTIISDRNVFVPQENTVISPQVEETKGTFNEISSTINRNESSQEFKLFTQENLNTESLNLPKVIYNEVESIIMAIARNRRVNKFLFSGKPGTGKTETVKHIARVLNRSLYSVNFESLIDSKLGQSGKNVSSLFTELNNVENSQHAIFLFDEIDVLTMDRLEKNDIREMGRITSFMLKGLENLHQEVTLFATTNLFESLDKALLRRFDTVVNFNRYTDEDLIGIAEMMLAESGKLNNVEIKNISFFTRILELQSSIPYPGELKNLINSSVAFSDPKHPEDYIRKLFSKIIQEEHSKSLDDIIVDLYNKEFSLREIETLTGVSRSQVSRMMKGEN